MAKGKKGPSSVIFGAKGAPSAPKPVKRLAESDEGRLHGSRPARMLAMIRRSMDLMGVLMRRRLRNEEILALAYQDGTMSGGAGEVENLREYAANYPYRYVRWLESQMVSEEIMVEVGRDAGAGQRPGGPGDEDTGYWVAESLKRIAYIAGFVREVKALGGEVLPRGTSVIRIGYHEQEINLDTSAEVGKDGQSVVPEVLGQGDLQAKPGQAHSEISDSLGTMAADPLTQMQVGQEGVGAILARKASHDAAELADETTDIPKMSTRLIRRRIWMRKLRVAEQCGWSPYVDDVEDADQWWERIVWTVAEVKASPLFTRAFKDKVKGYDARNVSGVSSGAQTPSTQSMGSDARAAQSEDVLDEDERMVEFFGVWCRRPDMKAGGVRYLVCAECPDEFVQVDESNPHVDPKTGLGLIPGFFPFFDFTPILSSITVPERTAGVAPIGVGMPQFEQIRELNRLLHESALRHALRFYDVHPAHKDNKKLLNALKNGEDGHAEIMKPAQIGTDGKPQPSIYPIQFSGNTLDLERNLVRAEGTWVKMMAMPPAVLQGVGTAGTAAQDSMGLAAGERESAALVGYVEGRMGDVFAGIRGLMRGCYDDEDFIALLGEEGAAVMKAWQAGTVDDGDPVKVTFGAHAQAEKTVRIKQIMEAISTAEAKLDPVTGQPKYDTTALFEELYRLLDCGKPKLSAANQDMLTKLAMIGKQVLEAQAAAQAQPGQTTTGASGGPPSGNGSATRAGPNPSEGSGPQQGTLAAGAKRGTFAPGPGG